MMYHFKTSRKEIAEMTDEEWAHQYAILTDIRKEEFKQKPF